MLIPTTPSKRWASPDTATCTDPPISPPEEAREECGKTTYSLEPNFRRMFEAINCATFDYHRRRVYFLLRLENAAIVAVDPALQSILNDINELSKEEDYDGYIFKPTPHARKSAKRFITETYQKMEGRLPRPRVVPDGKGGIIMEWRNGADVVKLGCVAADTRRDYIYYKRGNVYDAVEASVDDFIKWLHWLNHE